MLATPSTSSCANRSTLLERPLVVRAGAVAVMTTGDSSVSTEFDLAAALIASRPGELRHILAVHHPRSDGRCAVLPPTAALAVHAGSDRAARSAHSDGLTTATTT
jgi:hypothetical protein